MGEQSRLAWRWARRELPELLLLDLRDALIENYLRAGPLDFTVQSRTVRLGAKGQQKVFKAFSKPKGFLTFYSVYEEGHAYREYVSDGADGIYVRTSSRSESTYAHLILQPDGSFSSKPLTAADYQERVVRRDDAKRARVSEDVASSRQLP